MLYWEVEWKSIEARKNKCVNNRETHVTVKMQGVEDVKVADKIRNNTSEGQLRLSGF